jgi:DNA polymerase-1
VLAAAPAMKPGKMRDNLIEHADMARLSRKLVELHASGGAEPLDDFKLEGIPPEPLRAFLEDQGFKTLLRASRAVRRAPVADPVAAAICAGPHRSASRFRRAAADRLP